MSKSYTVKVSGSRGTKAVDVEGSIKFVAPDYFSKGLARLYADKLAADMFAVMMKQGFTFNEIKVKVTR